MTKKKDKIELSIKIFENLRTLISHADGKAGIALGLQTFIVTNVLGASLVTDAIKNISVLSVGQRRFFDLLLIFFILTAVLCIVFCVRVFMPRKPQEISEIDRAGITYFGHIKAFRNSSNYLDAFNKLDDDGLLEEFACQNYTLALIVDHKMRFAKYAVNALFINIFAVLVLLIFSVSGR